jgi:predicted nuclease with TOPRIM domain
MSTDRTTEILDYLSAISRDVGELRTDVNSLRAEVSTLRTEVNNLREEMNTRFSEVNTRLECLETEVTRIGREQRLQGRRLDRIEGLVLTTRGDVDELLDRVGVLEDKQA